MDKKEKEYINKNMRRNVEYGRKNLYFEDVEKCARFVNLYKDLFVAYGFRCDELKTSRGIIYQLSFCMYHKDMEKIRKIIPMKTKSFVRKDSWSSSYRYTRTFVV